MSREIGESLAVGIAAAVAITIAVLAPLWCVVVIAGAVYFLVVRPQLRELERRRRRQRTAPRAPRPAVRIDPAEPRDAVPPGYPGFRGSIRYVPFIEDAVPENPDVLDGSEASAT